MACTATGHSSDNDKVHDMLISTNVDSINSITVQIYTLLSAERKYAKRPTSPNPSSLDNSLENRDDDVVALAAATNVGGNLDSSLSVDDNTVGQSLLKGNDYKAKMLVQSYQTGIWRCKRTLSVVCEVECQLVAAVEVRVLSLDAGVPQLAIVAGVLVVCELGVEVDLANVGSEGDLDVPLALVVAGEDGGGGGAGYESEEGGGELHLDGDGVGSGWLVDGSIGSSSSGGEEVIDVVDDVCLAERNIEIIYAKP